MLKDWSKEALKLCNQNIGNVRDFFWCENPERYWHFGEVDSSEASLLYSESRNTIDDHHDSENIRNSVLRRLPIPSLYEDMLNVSRLPAKKSKIKQ